MQKKMGEDDPTLIEEISLAKLALEEKHDALLHELKTQWSEWDKIVEVRENEGTESGRRRILDEMVDVLNRRNYLRNLVRDVNEVLVN